MILNEEKYARDLYNGINNEIKSVVGKIGYITRYQLHALHYNDEDNYSAAVNWLQKHHNNFDESYYSNLISDAISRAYKYPFYCIDNIQITQTELDAISSLNNLRAEKVLFVLLCMAKHQSVSYGFTNGLVKYSLTDLCKQARISVPADQREYILYNIVQSGLLSCPKKNDTQCLIVNFLDLIGESVISIDEIDSNELAYVYLNWKNNGNGYRRCECCGKFIRQSKKYQQRFCENCKDIIGDISEDEKIIICVDCGQFVRVQNLNTKTCRCEACQAQYRKDYMKELMRGKRLNI